MKSIKNKIHNIFLCLTSTLLLSVAVICVAARIYETNPQPPLDLMAAEMTFPTGNAEYSKPLDRSSENNSSPAETSSGESEQPLTAVTDTSEVSVGYNNPSQQQQNQADDVFQASEPTKKELTQYDKDHKGEDKYPVTEFNTTTGNQSYGNVQIKNASSANIDIAEELEGKLGFTIEKNNQPQVLIYHTHTSESFLKYDTGYFYDSFYPRTTDPSQNVCAVGDEITKQLNKAGIKTIHDTTVHDYPSYNGAYNRSLETINKYLKKYPSIKVVLDIHRDGIGTDNSKSKPVFTVDEKKAAQVMILSGYNYDESEEFEDWEYNLRFALKIQHTAAEMYPEMMRPLYFADFMYNMNVNTGSLLIEIGAEANTIEEVRYSGYLLGKVLVQTLSTA